MANTSIVPPIHPETSPRSSGVSNTPIAPVGRSREIIFNGITPTSPDEDPMAIINRGIADQPLDVSRQKASVAIGETQQE